MWATFAEHVRPSGVLSDRDSTEEVVASVPRDAYSLPSLAIREGEGMLFWLPVP
jgi:hypothetical protein